MDQKDVRVGRYYLGVRNHVRLIVREKKEKEAILFGFDGDAVTYVTVYPPPPRTGANLSTITKRSFVKWAKKEVQPAWFAPFQHCPGCDTYHVVPEHLETTCTHCGRSERRKVVTACPPTDYKKRRR